MNYTGRRVIAALTQPAKTKAKTQVHLIMCFFYLSLSHSYSMQFETIAYYTN